MMVLSALIRAFILVSLAEFADKTQIATIMLASKFRSKLVFIGGLIGFMLVNIICFITGVCIGFNIPVFWTKIFASILFIVFGLLSLKGDEKFSINISSRRSVFITSLTLVASMELADKTNLAVIALSLESMSPISTFIGIFLSAIFMMAISTFIGVKIGELVKYYWIKILSSIVFIIIGVYILLELFYLS